MYGRLDFWVWARCSSDRNTRSYPSQLFRTRLPWSKLTTPVPGPLAVSDLWWTIPLRILLGQFWDTFRIPPDQTDRCPGAFGSRQSDHVIIFDLPYPAYGYTWVVLWLCFACPLPLRSLLHGPLSRVHFGESLVVRLYSEIDQIHLSSEAQCVCHHLPQVDCHRNRQWLLPVQGICLCVYLIRVFVFFVGND